MIASSPIISGMRKGFSARSILPDSIWLMSSTSLTRLRRCRLDTVIF